MFSYLMDELIGNLSGTTIHNLLAEHGIFAEIYNAHTKDLENDDCYDDEDENDLNFIKGND